MAHFITAALRPEIDRTRDAGAVGDARAVLKAALILQERVRDRTLEPDELAAVVDDVFRECGVRPGPAKRG